MAAKGSRLSRTIQFFRESDIEEARYVLGRAQDIVTERGGAERVAKEIPRKPRRTKAQMRTDRDTQSVESTSEQAAAAHHGV